MPHVTSYDELEEHVPTITFPFISTGDFCTGADFTRELSDSNLEPPISESKYEINKNSVNEMQSQNSISDLGTVSTAKGICHFETGKEWRGLVLGGLYSGEQEQAALLGLRHQQ